MSQAGYTPIQLYYSTTASTAPSAGNLANGELALNITDGKLFYKDNGGVVRVLAGTGGTGVVAGSNTQVQYNNNGVFGASSALTFDGSNLSTTILTTTSAIVGGTFGLVVGGALNGTTINSTGVALGGTQTLSINGGTANGVAFLNASKVLTTGSALTFDGTNLFTTGDINSDGSEKYINFRSTYSVGSNVRARIRAVGAGGGSGYGGDFRVDTRAPNNAWNTDAFVINSNGQPIWTFGGSEQMRLTSTGLGIGTSSPAYKLTVEGTLAAKRSGANQYVALSTASGEGYFDTINTLSTDNIPFYFRQTNTGGTTTRMTLDSAGNLGLGVTPSAWASSVKALELPTGAFYSFASGSVSNFYSLTNAYLNGAGSPIYKQSSFATQYLQTAGQHQWYTAPSGTAGNAISFTQAMTLDASGNLLVGTTSNTYGNRVEAAGGFASLNSQQFNIIASNTSAPFEWVLRGGTGMAFYVNNATVLATLSSSGVWTNASDARYKENIRPVSYGLAEVMQLQPRAYNLIGSDKQEIGFVAQEVEPFIPELVESATNSVTGEDRLTLSYGQISAVLVKAIQEQQALIQTLTARVAALESN